MLIDNSAKHGLLSLCPAGRGWREAPGEGPRIYETWTYLPHFDPIIQARDAARTEQRQQLGITLLCFDNIDVIDHPRIVFEQIEGVACQLKWVGLSRPLTR